MSLLQCRGLDVSVADVNVVAGLDLHLEPGMIVGILGANGAGKTTLLHTLAGLRAPQGGQVLLESRAVGQWPSRARARALGILFQDIDFTPQGNVLQHVLAARHPHLARFSMEQPEDYAIAEATLGQTGLLERRQQRVETLSGGERKRLGVATLLCQRARVNLLDEPNSHLDLRYQISMLELIRRHILKMNGVGIIVLHDVNLLLRFCTHGLLLFGDGAYCFDSTEACITSTNLGRLFKHPMQEIFHQDGRYFLPG